MVASRNTWSHLIVTRKKGPIWWPKSENGVPHLLYHSVNIGVSTGVIIDVNIGVNIAVNIGVHIDGNLGVNMV